MVRSAVYLLVVALAACSAPSPAPPPTLSSDAEDTCTPWTQFAARIPPAAHLTAIPDVAAFLKAWNATPPESETEADQVFVARRGHRVEVFFVVAGCLAHHGSIPAEDFARLLGAET